MRETASSETDCTSDSAQTQQQSESRVSAKARNPANEMRFPVSREAGGNASALAPCRGGRRRHSLARTRGAATQAVRDGEAQEGRDSTVSCAHAEPGCAPQAIRKRLTLAARPAR